MGSYSSNMGEYSVGVRCFDGSRDCEECKTIYKSGYEFMYLSCACGCETSFRICSICSPMYMKCDCGCKGSFAVCKQRPEYGSINVRDLKTTYLFKKSITDSYFILNKILENYLLEKKINFFLECDE